MPPCRRKEATFAPRARLDGIRALAIDGKPGPALAEVIAMLDSGYDDLTEIESDPDLAAVRKLPEFAPEFARSIQAGVTRDLARGKSVPVRLRAEERRRQDRVPGRLQGQGHDRVDIWGTWS